MITVVGGANVDIIGTAAARLIPRDSNPGRVVLSPGGVGRNMAERFRALGHEVRLITALGDDAHARFLREHCAQVGIDLSHALTAKGGRTGAYLCINSPDGDLALAVSDMEICGLIAPAFLESRLDAIDESALVVLDANLNEDALSFLAGRARAPLAADPVSVAKASRLAGVLHRLALIKPNVPEAERLTGLTAARDGVERLARALYDRGVERVLLSLGARGAYYLDARGEGALPCYKGPIIDTTGCGDAFLAAAASAMLLGADTRACAAHGLAAAALMASRRPFGADAVIRVIKDGGVSE